MAPYLPTLIVQGTPVPGDVAATWTKFETEARRLSGEYPGVRLLVWPELYLTAPGGPAQATPPEAWPDALAESIPGPTTSRLGDVARETGAWLIPGSIYERGDGDGVHNTLVVVGPDGSLAATYRKIFPWKPFEETEPGSQFIVLDIDGVRVGVMICYDGWFPEVARQLAWLGAEVIVQVSYTPTWDRDQEIALARANAIVNQAYVVNANVGSPGLGRSVIVDPDGRILQQAGAGEAYLAERLDAGRVRDIREHGTVGLNRLWQQLDADGPALELPMYGGRIRPRS